MSTNKTKLSFKIPAIQISQKEDSQKAIYIGTISAKDLASYPEERFKIDYFSRDGGNSGYQRSLQNSKIEKIKDFILAEIKHPLFPTAILVNSRTKLDFKGPSGDFGHLEINEPLWVIDGQHRVTAWRAIMNDAKISEEWENYQFPIVILSGFIRTEEMEQFYVINSRQTKIKTDLVHTLLLEFEKNIDTQGLVKPKDKWIPRAVVITEGLNKKGIWKDKIGYDTDTDLQKKTKVIQATSFHTSLKPLFVGNKKLFDIDSGQINIDKWINFLSKFWDIVAQIYPHATDNVRGYSLMKTVGVNALNILLVDKASELNLGIDHEEVLLKNVRETLERASRSDFTEDFWRSHVSPDTRRKGKYAGAFSSSSGHARLAAGLFVGRLTS